MPIGGENYFPKAADGSASVVFWNVTAGQYHLFVKNIGCILYYKEKPVISGAIVCKCLEPA